MTRKYNYKIVQKECLGCGSAFKGHSNTRYCSNKCRDSKSEWSRKKQLNRISNLEHFLKEKINLARARNKYIVDIDYNYINELWKSQDGMCAISKIPMTYIKGNGKVNTNVSMDRIDSNIGYIKGNIQLVCTQVNYMKNDLSTEDLKTWCEAILNAT